MSKKIINFIVTVVIVVTICLITFSITYAFFLMSKETNSINNTSTAGKLEVIYQNGQDITGRLLAYNDNSKALSTTATIKKSSASVDGLATITLHISNISDELKTEAFKWEVYENDGTTPISNGNFNGKNANDTIDVISNYPLTTTDTVFTIKLWIDSALNANSLYNKTFSGYIDASAVNTPARTS